MPHVRPGRYMLYCPEERPDRPPWPVVVLKNDILPPVLRKAKLYELDVPIFLFQKAEVRWIYITDLKEIGTYICPDELARKHPGLREAHSCMIEAIADDLPLRHWKIVVYSAHGLDCSEPQLSPTDTDADTKKAIRASLSQQKGRKRPATEDETQQEEGTAIERAIKRRLLGTRSSRKATKSHKSDGSEDEALDPSFTGQDENYIDARSSSGEEEANLELSDSNGGDGNALRVDLHNGSSSQQEQRADSEEEDDEDEELIGKDMACWLIGPSYEKFYIPRKAVLSRDHLVKMDILIPKGRNKWRVTKPSFARINPDHFRPVAQYLCTGDFAAPTQTESGEPLTEDERKSAAIELYANAWEVAQNLSLDDLMQKIAAKMEEIQPWPLLELLLFACRVYAVPSAPAFSVPADLDMRATVSVFIATNYERYRSEYGPELLRRLKKFPELNRNVHQALADQAAEELEQD